jgi:hypothetical protein
MIGENTSNFYFCSPSEREIVTKMIKKIKLRYMNAKINIKSE